MSGRRTGIAREPLIHLSKRDTIHPLKAWGIRLLAVLLGMIVCGLVAFLLIERLQNKPARIGDFYYAFKIGRAHV